MGVVALLCTGRGNPATVKTMAVLSRMLVKPAFQPLASAQSFISKVPKVNLPLYLANTFVYCKINTSSTFSTEWRKRESATNTATR